MEQTLCFGHRNILGLLWDHVGITLGSLWDHFGVIFGAVESGVGFGRSPRRPIFFFKLKKNEAHAAYWSKKAIDEHGWSDRQLFKKRRGTWTSKCKKSKKQSSGSPEWVGTKEVIEKMLRDIPRRS